MSKQTSLVTALSTLITYSAITYCYTKLVVNIIKQQICCCKQANTNEVSGIVNSKNVLFLPMHHYIAALDRHGLICGCAVVFKFGHCHN